MEKTGKQGFIQEKGLRYNTLQNMVTKSKIQEPLTTTLGHQSFLFGYRPYMQLRSVLPSD